MNIVWIATLVWIGVESGWGRELGSTHEEVVANQWNLARWLSWGLLLGGTVQLVLHFPPLRSHGLVGPTEGERRRRVAGAAHDLPARRRRGHLPEST
jgi:peptidoglycan biosynthesis protein MviN/MurJ (putative lipid II flippase)